MMDNSVLSPKPFRGWFADGECIYCAGFTHLIPFAAAARDHSPGRRDLVLARATPDLIYDQMECRGLCAQDHHILTWAIPAWGSLRVERAADRGRETGMGGVFPFGMNTRAPGRRGCRSCR